MDKEEITIVILGETGVGKSSIGNAILGKECFREYGSIHSETKKVKQSYGYLFNNRNYQKLSIIDTPGFNDSKGMDNKHIESIVDFVKDLEFVNCFLIVFNSDNIRWNEGTQEIISLLNKIFPNFWSNVIIVLNHWSNSEEANKIRLLQRRPEEKKIDDEISDFFKIKYYVNIPIVKLNSIARNFDETHNDKINLKREILNCNKIWSNFYIYKTDKIEIAKKKNDEIQDQLIQRINLLEKNREEDSKKLNTVINFISEKRGRQSDNDKFTEIFFSMTVPQIKILCDVYCPDAKGLKLDLIKRLSSSIDFNQKEELLNYLPTEDLKKLIKKFKLNPNETKMNLIKQLIDNF